MATGNYWRGVLTAPLLLVSTVMVCLSALATVSVTAQLAVQPTYSSPQEVLETSLQSAIQQANLPYRSLRLIALSNDGSVARFRVVVELRPGEDRPWEENEREVEVRFSEGSWQAPHIPPYFAWQFTADERARRARLVRVEVLQTTVIVDPIEHSISVPLRVINADTWGYASLYFRATFQDASGRVLHGPAGEAAWAEGAGPLVVPWGMAEEPMVPVYVDLSQAGVVPPAIVTLTEYGLRLGRDGPWETSRP